MTPSHAERADAGAVRSATTTPQRPNILLITSDDLSIMDLRYMPHVRKLIGDEGVTLTDALAPTPLCVPSRASLLTGTYAHNDTSHSISGFDGGYQSLNEADTLPVALQEAGYDTLFTGKFLNGYGEDGPEDEVPAGWTDWRGTVDPSTYNYRHPIVNDNGVLTRYNDYTTNVMSAEANEMLSAPEREQKPWFMWLSYVAPHVGGASEPGETVAPDSRSARVQRVATRYTGRKHVPAYVKREIVDYYFGTPVPTAAEAKKSRNVPLPHRADMFQVRSGSLPVGSPVGEFDYTPLVQKAAKHEFDRRVAAARSVDQAVATQIATLKATGQLKNTLVVFDSDNGYVTGEHSINGKLWGYNEITRIPMLVRGPGVPVDKKVNTAVTIPDLTATILAAAQAQPLDVLDGQDFLPWLSQRNRWRTTVLEGWPVKGVDDQEIYTGIRLGPWTYIRYPGQGEELYDRTTDPYELHNLTHVKADSYALNELRLLSDTYDECAGSSCPHQLYKPGQDPVSVAMRTHQLVTPTP